MVSLAGTLGIAKLQSKTEQFLNYFLDTQGPDGWLGPEVNAIQRRRLSPRYVRLCCQLDALTTMLQISVSPRCDEHSGCPT